MEKLENYVEKPKVGDWVVVSDSKDRFNRDLGVLDVLKRHDENSAHPYITASIYEFRYARKFRGEIAPPDYYRLDDGRVIAVVDIQRIAQVPEDTKGWFCEDVPALQQKIKIVAPASYDIVGRDIKKKCESLNVSWRYFAYEVETPEITPEQKRISEIEARIANAQKELQEAEKQLAEMKSK